MIEQIKQDLARNYENDFIVSDGIKHEIDFIVGFDSCMDLELPIKFAEWKQNNFYDGKQINGVWCYTKSMYLNPEWKTLKQLFDYWIENVYKKEI